jgi:ABC-type bacteriocin/lantibiotic exporter with double-glycine peptidase domain
MTLQHCIFRSFFPLVVGWHLASVALAGQQSGVWLDVPFVRQEKNGGGAASIAMVMQYWRRQNGQPGQLGDAPADDPEGIQRALYSPSAQGIYASSMDRYFGQHGFRTFVFAGDWNVLKGHLERGRPLIVALKSGRSSLHYVVVAGLDWQQNVVLKNDPAERKLLKQDRPNFEKEWKAAGNWTLLAVPRQEATSHPSRAR